MPRRRIRPGSIMRRYGVNSVFAFAVNITFIAGMLLMMPACMPTYPKETLSQTVKAVCKVEYGMDVDVTVKDSTMGIYYPMKGLLNVSLGINEEAWDEISNLVLVASRVVLSTDANIKFYCVITQDVRLPELQMVIIKHDEDVKHGMYRHISRGESFKRTLFSVNLTPQAEKERSIEKIFNKLGVADETREKVLQEFFRSSPTRLSDIGYWRGNFYLKDITMEEFLASQIANRIKIDFQGDKKLTEFYNYKSSEGNFVSEEREKFFLINFKIFDQEDVEKDIDLRLRKIQQILHITNEVVYGYKFRDFDFLLLQDQLENAKLRVSGQDVYDFNKKNLLVQDIVQAPAGYFQ